MNKDFKLKLIKDVNTEIKKTIDFLNENKNVWGTTRTFKLHDVINYICKDENFNIYKLTSKEYDRFELFCDFCELEYDYFKEWLKEARIDNSIFHYIGRTSKFYLTQDNTIEDIFYNLTNLELPKNSIDIIDILGENGIELEDKYVVDDMNYILDNLYENALYYLEDAIKVAEYIDSYKDNQVDIFISYLKDKEDELEYDNLIKTQELNKAIQNVKSIVNKYNITDEDFEKLKNNLKFL